MRVVQQTVNGGGGQGFRHQLVEPNWNWHTFVWGQNPCDLVLLPFGVSPGFRGVIRGLLGATLILLV